MIAGSIALHDRVETMRCTFALPTLIGAILLLLPFEAVGAGRIELQLQVNPGSSPRLAQASAEQLKTERKRYEAASKRARAALEAERPARSVNEGSPHFPVAQKDMKEAVCIAGC